MKMAILFFIFSVSFPVWAFDRLNCQSRLSTWKVSPSSKIQESVITASKKDVQLTEKESSSLYILDEVGHVQLVVYPWDAFYAKVPEDFKKNYAIDQSSNDFGFSLEIRDLKTTVQRTLNCQFTF